MECAQIRDELWDPTSDMGRRHLSVAYEKIQVMEVGNLKACACYGENMAVAKHSLC